MKSNGHASRSWRRRLFAAAATVMLALGIATPTAALAENAGSVVDRTPTHSKTITDNGNGTYDLTLSVTGDTEQSSSAKPVDVVFVVDVSSSMNKTVDGWFGLSRMKAAHDAAASLANSLLTGENANKQIQVSVVTFGTNAQVATGFTSDPSVVANAVPERAKENQGTNWEGGLKLANAQTSGREGAEKHIVFLSDGNPTYRVSPMGYTESDESVLGAYTPFPEKHDHKVNDNLYGFGNAESKENRNYAAAKAEANNRNGANMFVVSVAKDADKMQSFATDTTGTFLDGTTADNLASAFSQIGQVITKTAGYKDVKIVDQLTQWVEGTAADGSIENVRYAKNGEAWNDAPPASVINGGTLNWDLSGVGELEKGVTYSVTFTIRPSDAAKAAVAAAGVDKTFETNVNAGSYVEYRTVQKQTGQDDIVSDVKTANFDVPTIELAAPAPVTVDGAKNLAGQKTLKGRALAAGEFSFTISAADGSAADTPLPAETTVFNEADGSFHFGNIAFAKTGTYLYDVAEDTSALPKGVKPVTQGAERVKVDVTVNEAGELVASVTAPEGGLSFVNEYGTNDATVSLHGRKSIDAASGLTAPTLNGGDYQFTLTAKTVGAPMPANQTEAVVSNDAAGDFHFDDITFTKDGLGNEMSKTFEYTVTESGSKPGVTNDDAHTIEVTVTDNGEGKLTAVVTKGNLNFVNTYSATAVDFSVSQNVSVTKQLDGRDLKQGEFTFELVEGNQVVATATNAADGSVVFDAQHYTEPGKHVYTIREAQGDVAGVSYDPKTYTVTVNVEDHGEGQLVASTEGASEIVFNNTYAAAPATVNLTATKVLEGADLSDGQFTFDLLNNGDVMDRATNDAKGNVAFRELTLKQAGTYTFTMREVAGDVEGMTYDTAEHTIKISVVDKGEGQLEATVEGNNPTFTNSYTAPAAKPSEPEQPAKQLPQTGDTNNATLPIVFAVAAVICIAAGVTVSRKRK